MDKAL
jgi:hypothetical protein